MLKYYIDYDKFQYPDKTYSLYPITQSRLQFVFQIKKGKKIG